MVFVDWLVEILTDHQLRAKMTARGTPDRAMYMALGLYITSQGGEFEMVDPTLERLLGCRLVRKRNLLTEKIRG